MTETRQPTRLGEAIRRQWIVVLIAAVIGLVAAYALAGTGSSSTWKGSQSVTVTQLPLGVVNAQRAAVVVTAASTSAVLHAAETSLGVAHGTLNGAVSAAIAVADNSTMTITVTAPSKAAALARVEAVTAAAVNYVLAPYGSYFAQEEALARDSEAQAQALQAQIATLKSTASAVPLANRAGYYSAIIAATSQRYNELTDAATARQKIEAIKGSVYVNGAARAGRSATRLRLSSVAQGLLLGIVAGIIIALVREWLRTRPVTAPPADA